MRIRQINSILWLTMACCVGLGVLSLGLALAMPLNMSRADQVNAIVPSRATTTKPVPETFEQIASRNFRASPNDGPAVVKTAGRAPNAAALSPSAPVLVGTIGDSLAMFRMPDGTIALKGVGDDVEGATVIAIHPERVELQSNGVRRTVSIQKSPGPPGVSLDGASP